MGGLEIKRQGPRQRPDKVIAPVLPQRDIEDIHLQHVAGHSPAHRHGSGQDMPRHRGHARRMHVQQFGRHMKPLAGQVHWAAGNRFNRHFIAAVDGQNGGVAGVEKPPMAGLWGRL